MTDRLLYFILCCLLAASVGAQSITPCETYAQSPIPVDIYGQQSIFSPAHEAVYMFGGTFDHYEPSLTVTTSFYDGVLKWDLSQPDSWFTRVGDIPSNTDYIVSYGNNVVLVGDLAYFIGTYDRQIHVYDLQTEAWVIPHNVPPPPDSLAGGCLASTDTHIYVVGGSDKTNTHRDPMIYIYNIENNAWESVPLGFDIANEGGWNSQYCAVVDNELYMFGGDTHWGENEDMITNAYRMDCATRIIQQLPSLPEPQAFGRAVYHQRKIYLVGAYLNDDSFKSEVVAFDLATQEYTNAFPIDPAVIGAAVVSFGGNIFIFGGEYGTTFLGVLVSIVVSDKAQACLLPSSPNPTLPSAPPSQKPSVSPSEFPSVLPSLQPSVSPSQTPSFGPSSPPSPQSSVDPGVQPPMDPTTPPIAAEPLLPEEEPVTTTTNSGNDSSDERSNESSSSSKDSQIIIGLSVAFVVICGALYWAQRCWSWKKQEENLRNVRNNDDAEIEDRNSQRNLDAIVAYARENAHIEDMRGEDNLSLPAQESVLVVDARRRENIELAIGEVRVRPGVFAHERENALVEDTRGEDNLSLPAQESVLRADEGVVLARNQERRQSQQYHDGDAAILQTAVTTSGATAGIDPSLGVYELNLMVDL